MVPSRAFVWREASGSHSRSDATTVDPIQQRRRCQRRVHHGVIVFVKDVLESAFGVLLVRVFSDVRGRSRGGVGIRRLEMKSRRRRVVVMVLTMMIIHFVAPPPPLILSPRHYWNPSCDTSLRFLRCSSSLPSPPLVSSLQQYHPKFSCSSSSPQKQSRRADQRYPLRHRLRRRTSCTPPSMFLRRSNWLVDFGSSPPLSPTWCLSGGELFPVLVRAVVKRRRLRGQPFGVRLFDASF